MNYRRIIFISILIVLFVLANIYYISEKRVQNQEFYNVKMPSSALLKWALLSTSDLIKNNEKSKEIFYENLKYIAPTSDLHDMLGNLYFIKNKNYTTSDPVIILYNKATKRSDGITYIFGITIDGDNLDIPLEDDIIDKLNENYFNIDFKGLPFRYFESRKNP